MPLREKCLNMNLTLSAFPSFQFKFVTMQNVFYISGNSGPERKFDILNDKFFLQRKLRHLLSYLLIH